MKANKSLPRKIATAAVWLVAVPAIAIVRALRAEGKPTVEPKTAK